ncbi:TolC family protein [Porphyromonas pogonae]|uniref:TolC family protein n=1 Tax=Porphyromonas pogonae TaxID=867595 RepID=UPI002E75AFA1|nr:TolC family protein [Porphyromonas pogonae]
MNFIKRKVFVRLISTAILAFAMLANANAQRVLSLDSCRALSVANNKELEQQNYKIEAAKFKKAEVDMNFFPKISAQGAYLHSQKALNLVDWDDMLGPFSILVPYKVQDMTHIDMSNAWVGNVSLVQPIFMGGKIAAGHRMASYAEKLTYQMKDTKYDEVEKKLDETYWQVVSLKSKERLVNQLIALLQSTVKDVDASIAAGVATKSDGLTVRVKLSEAEVKLSKVQNGLKLSRMLLCELCGLDLEEDFVLQDELNLDSIAPTPWKPRAYNSQQVNSSVERRSEIKSLKLVDSIYGAKEKYEAATMLPKLAMFGAYTTTKPNSFHGFKNEFGGQFQVGLMMQIPITDILTGRFKVKQAQAERVIKRLELADAREKIELQIRQALFSNTEAHKQLQVAQKGLETAEENLRYAKVGYDEGVIPLLNYTMAQTAWLSAKDSFIEAQVGVKLSESNLKRILAEK